jgi:hypothetical protein
MNYESLLYEAQTVQAIDCLQQQGCIIVRIADDVDAFGDPVARYCITQPGEKPLECNDAAIRTIARRDYGMKL